MADALYEFVKKNGTRLYTCSHTIAEIGSAAARQHREGRFTRDDALAIFNLFLYDSQKFVHFIEIGESLLYESVNLMMNQPLKAGDGMHLSAAMVVHSVHGNEMRFVSDDVKLCNAALNLGLNVLQPSDTRALNFVKNLQAK